MNILLCGCREGELSFKCALALADAAQAKGDTEAAEQYIQQVFAAVDRGIAPPVPNFALHEVTQFSARRRGRTPQGHFIST
jgi:hypothetical protein